MNLQLRGKTWYLRRRVPLRYQPVEQRLKVEISLHTDSQSLAESKAQQIWDNLISTWEARLQGGSQEAELEFEVAREIAQRRGFKYLPAEAVLKGPVEDLLDRIEAIADKQQKPIEVEARALLGVTRKPVMTISRALEIYWDISKDQLFKKSEDQTRRWKNPIIKAVGNLIGVIGDKPLDQITADDMLDFRRWWSDRLQAEGLHPSSANKDFSHFGKVLKRVNEMKRLGLTLPLGGFAFKGSEQGQRPSFSDDWIRSRLLKPGALSGLNADARGLLLGMINTGYRPSEGAILTNSQIRLDGEVPYISIEPVGRELKTSYSKRRIPLVGVFLEVFRENPEGFEKYRDNNATLSATVNKFLAQNGMKETPDHTMYSLRHAFEDRMLAAGFDERIRRNLFGHALDRQRYGQGATLEHIHRLLQGIAL